MIEILVSLILLAGPNSDSLYPASSTSVEKPDEQIERSARAYRILVYRTFHDNRPEFDRRRAAANQVLRDWFIAGQTAEDSELIVRWFEQAQAITLAGVDQPLPEPPTLIGTTDSPASIPTGSDDTDESHLFPPPATRAGAFPPVPPADVLDAPGEFDEPSATDEEASTDIFSTTSASGAASESGSPLKSLGRALWKAAATISQESN